MVALAEVNEDLMRFWFVVVGSMTLNRKLR